MPMPPATMSCAAPTRVLCPEMRFDHLRGQVGLACHALEDSGHLPRLQSLADLAPRERAEDASHCDIPLRSSHTRTSAMLSRATGLVILLYKLLSRTGAGGSEKGSRRAVPVR